jgi:glucose-6-phosphate 1-dehydrogenase
MEGETTLFAREDYVEEAWRIVGPVLHMSTPIYQYQANTWGPREVERVTPMGGWHNPMIGQEVFSVASEAA